MTSCDVRMYVAYICAYIRTNKFCRTQKTSFRKYVQNTVAFFRLILSCLRVWNRKLNWLSSSGSDVCSTGIERSPEVKLFPSSGVVRAAPRPFVDQNRVWQRLQAYTIIRWLLPRPWRIIVAVRDRNLESGWGRGLIDRASSKHHLSGSWMFAWNLERRAAA